MLGLTKLINVWSKKELDLIKRLYPKRTAQEIADKIGRSAGAVRLRIFNLGLKKRGVKTKKK